MDDDMKLVDRYRICVGLNDKDSNTQLHDTEKYLSVISYVCRSNRIEFSAEVQNGGYFYKDGGFAKERSLAVTLVGATKEAADELGAELCALFNQETVLILHDRVEAYFVSREI